LRTFLIDEVPNSIVITIPASFDTIQSTATKEAGLAAGFKEVVLLQEPVAACLAVFNQFSEIEEGKWLIYDLGGGTFDVAIVDVSHGELKVLDHQGNNFLGGLDFDISIVNNFILPQLKTQGNFDRLIENIQNNKADKDPLSIFNYLLYYAEQLKIELTTYPESYAEFQLKDDDGEYTDIEIKLTREEFNSAIEQGINQTLRLVKDLIASNNLNVTDFKEMVLVGGSTYSPFIREKIEQEIGIAVNQKVDPTTAIVVGAAHYAANKAAKFEESQHIQKEKKGGLPELIPVYESQSRDKSELVIIKTKSLSGKFFFRVNRSDNAYDSGKLILEENNRITVPLNEKANNNFVIELYDENGMLLDSNASGFSITQGLFVIDGQPLPHDICIEVDDLNFNETKLQTIFQKNNILPLQKSIYKTVSRNMLFTSDDELLINILEGDRNASPATNQIIGCIAIRPKAIGKNLIKDSEIEITLNISEDRELSISASIPALDYDIKNVFNPNSKSVNSSKLREELNFLIFKSSREKEKALNNEDFEKASIFHQVTEEAQQALEKIGSQGEIDTDTKYHVDEWKRQLAVKYDSQTRNARLIDVLDEYHDLKTYVQELSNEPDFSDRLKSKLKNVLANEQEAIANSNVMMIKELQRQLDDIQWEYRKTNVNELRAIFFHYQLLFPDGYTDPRRAEEIIKIAETRLHEEGVTPNEFYIVFGKLNQFLKPEHLKKDNDNEGFTMKGTGLQ
jgi:molecular chaperone DnaK